MIGCNQHLRQRTRPRRARKRRGYAMLLVMVIILVSTSFAVLHQRHLNSALRIEQARVRSEDFRSGPVSVLAIACERLESGTPAEPSYHYDHTDTTGTTIYRVDYSLSGTQWTVTAEPDATASTLPDLPTTF